MEAFPLWSTVLLVAIAWTLPGQSRAAQYCGGKPADIIFVIDDSTSIWSVDFNRRLIPFVRDVVEMLDVGPGANQTRIGAVKFSSFYKLEFYLDGFLEKAALLKRILEIRSEGGNTATGDAINFATDVMFTRRHGMRDKVAHVMVVLTDGASQDRGKTRLAARKAQDKGISIFAIGVGSKINETELSDIASDPDEVYMVKVTDFSALDRIKEELALHTCRTTMPPTTTTLSTTTTTTTPAPTTTTTTPAPTTTTTTPAPTTTHAEHAAGMQGDQATSMACGGKPADIYFVVDTSSSIVPSDFNNEMLPFMQGVVNNFDIGPGSKQTRVGVVTFSDDYTPVFGLDAHLDRKSLLSALTPKVVRFLEGGTRPDKALRYVREFGLSPDVARPGVAHVVVLVTDGMSEDPDATLLQARAARQEGIYVFAIGVGLADQQELMDIASRPTDQFAFNVSDYRSLAKIRNLLAIKTCNLTRQQMKDQPKCDFKEGEVVFTFDPSSMGLHGTRQVTEVIDEAIRPFYHEPGVTLGLATGGCQPLESVSSSGAGDFRRSLVEGADAQTPQLVRALQNLRRKFYRKTPRDSSMRKAVVFADKAALEERQRLGKEARNLQFQQIDVKLVAIGDVDQDVALRLAGSPDDIVRVASYDSLASALPEILHLIC